MFPSAPMDVQVSIKLDEITKVDDVLDTVHMVAYINVGWADNRLAKSGNKNETIEDNGSIEKVDFVSQEWQDKLWLPDLGISGLQDLKMATFLHPRLSKG